MPHDYMIGRGKIEIRADDKGDGQKGTREMDRREQGRWAEVNLGDGQKGTKEMDRRRAEVFTEQTIS